jgi:hypothetical protein
MSSVTLKTQMELLILSRAGRELHGSGLIHFQKESICGDFGMYKALDVYLVHTIHHEERFAADEILELVNAMDIPPKFVTGRRDTLLVARTIPVCW